MSKVKLCKVAGMILGIACLLACLSGCGQSDGDEHEAITILTGRTNYAEFVELLEETYPEVNLEFINYYGGDTSNYMLETLKHGDIPDIFAISFNPDGQLQKENLLDLSNYSMINEYASTMLDSLNVDGGIYLLPSSYSLIGTVYNKTLMEENDWEVPQSFEELKALAPRIEAAGYKVMDEYSALTGTTFGAFFALGSTNYFNTPEGDQWKVDFLKGDAKAVGSLGVATDYFQEWIDEGFITSYYFDHPEANFHDDFDNGKIIFNLYSNRLTGENTDYEYGFMPILSSDGENNMLVRLVNRYYGLSKKLGEKGNEQKLEDALKVLELMSTPEGQQALTGNNPSYIPSTSINELPEGSPYTDVLDLINSGNMVDMVYAGWENHILPIITDYAMPWISGKTTATDFLKGMDIVNTEVLSGASISQLGTAEKNFTVEEMAKLCAISMGKSADADVAIVSMPGFHGFAGGANLENKSGVNCGIYQGHITNVTVNIFAPTQGSIQTVKLTGSEIKALVEAGLTLEGDPTPYEYCMVTKGNIELEDDKEYTLAVSDMDLSNSDAMNKAKNTGVAPKDAITAFIKEIKTVTADSIVWE